MIIPIYDTGAVINESALLCLLGALWGLWVLFTHLKISKANIATRMCHAFPILIGTLAWTSAAFTFATSPQFDSPIDGQRVMMVISWAMLSSQYRYRYRRKNKSQPQSTDKEAEASEPT